MKEWYVKGLAIQEQNAKYCPVLICQICNENISNKKNEGMLFYNDEAAILAHKKCMNSHYDRQYPYSEELSSFFGDLLQNAQIKSKNEDL